MLLGERIRFFRQQAGLTQIELGLKIGKSGQVISNWERGYTTGVVVDDIERLSAALGVDPKQLIKSSPDADDPAGYYLDAETARRAEEMRTRPGLRVLFDASRKLKPQDLEEVNALIQAKLKRPEYDE